MIAVLLARAAAGVLAHAQRHRDERTAAEVLELAEGVELPAEDLLRVTAGGNALPTREDDRPRYWWERDDS